MVLGANVTIGTGPVWAMWLIGKFVDYFWAKREGF
jgi:hypothetical protein